MVLPLPLPRPVNGDQVRRGRALFLVGGFGSGSRLKGVKAMARRTRTVVGHSQAEHRPPHPKLE